MKYLEITHLPYIHTHTNPSLAEKSPLSLTAAVCARLCEGEHIELRIEKQDTFTRFFLGLQVSEIRLKQILMYLKQSGYLTREATAFLTDPITKVTYTLTRNTRFFTGPGEHFSIEPVYTKDTLALLNIFNELPSGTGISLTFSKSQQLSLLTRSNLEKFKHYPHVETILSLDKTHQLYTAYLGIYGEDAGFLAEELAYRLNMRAVNVEAAIVNSNCIAQSVRKLQLPQARYMEELQYTFSISEIAIMTDLANCTDIPGGLPGNPDTLVSETYQDTPNIHDKKAISIGSTMDGRSVSLSFRQLKQHMWISGPPGSGKGNLLIGLATQLGLEKIPLLLLESAKTEQHYLRRVLPNLQVWRPLPGEMVMNPFAVPDGITLGEYKSSLMQTLQHCFKLDGVLEEWFQQAMNNCYIKNGWTDNSTNSSPNVTFFGIHEFIIEFKRLLDESTYDKRVKSDVTQGGIARLNALFQQSEMVYDSINSIPCKDMLSGINLVQLNSIPTIAGKQQFATLLLIQLSAYMRLRFGHVKSNEIRLVIMLDEAHNLLQGVIDSQGNTYSFADDFIGLLLELRALGVAFIISNQSTQGIPKLIPDICGTKVFLGGGALASGIKDYAEEMHLNETTFQHLYQCGSGQGLVYHAEMPTARFFQTPNIIDKLGMKTPYPTQNQYVENKKQLFVETYRECSICPTRGKCNMKLKQEAHRIAVLLNTHFGNKLQTALSSKDDKAVSKACSILMVEISMMLLDETKAYSNKEHLQNCALIQFSRIYNRSLLTPVSIQAILDSCRERIKILQNKQGGN